MRTLITHDMRRWSCSVCNFEISSAKSLARLKGDYKVKLADGDEVEDEGEAKNRRGSGGGGEVRKVRTQLKLVTWTLGQLDVF